MDFGIALAPAADAYKTVCRAEKLGFTHAWFYDTQLLCADPFVAMAAAAVHTSRIVLGTGVLIPSNRIAPSASAALASLNQLAPGRIVCGVGTGFTGRRTMGLGALRLAELREYVRVVRGLLAGETVECGLEGVRRKVRFLNPELGLIHTGDPVPVHVSAMGPRARRVAAQIGDGWLNFLFEQALAEADVRDALAAWSEAGRDPETCYTTGMTLGCVLADGEPEDGPRARAQAGPLAAVRLHALVETPGFLSLPDELRERLEGYRRIYEAYEPADARYLTLHRGHLLFLRPEEEPFIDAAAIRELTFTGTVETLRARVRALRDAGYRQLAIQLVPGHEDAIEDWAKVFEGV